MFIVIHGATIVCRNYSHVPYMHPHSTPTKQFLKGTLSSKLLGRSSACCIRSSDLGPFPLSFPAVKVLLDRCNFSYLLALSLGPRWSEEGSYRGLESPRFMTRRHQLCLEFFLGLVVY
ncbi:hypothetical protein CDAR_533711 [Caerostris darwini]|uniref:Uncharacterized protein n=1 Tax=Caerostris darwini TaxID=1538125 RepID=A0AAV4SAI7_9ARAC|nr:hypothetical protein CDAR_533711 [Caerostris darwini]